jgi:uncharacterized protein YpbB
MVAPNSSLRSLCEYLPINHNELLEVSGFGKAKAQKYGAEILDMVQDYCALNQIEKSLVKQTKASSNKRKASTVVNNNTKKIPSSQISLDMYLQGHSFEHIAQQRNLALSTVEGHIVECINNGKLPIERYLDTDTIEHIGAQIQQHPDKILTELVKLLEDKYSYSQIRAVQYHLQRVQEG